MSVQLNALTISEVAHAAGCTERCIYRWRKRPDFPRPLALPYASRVLFDAREVEAYLAKRREAAA